MDKPGVVAVNGRIRMVGLILVFLDRRHRDIPTLSWPAQFAFLHEPLRS